MTNGRAPPSTKAKIVQFTRGAAVLAAAALVTGGLTACGEDEPVDPSSTSTLSPLPGNSTSDASSSSSSSDSSTSSSDSTSEPTNEDVPALATEQSKAGAVAFTTYWFEESGQAVQDGDTAWIDKHADKSCAPCSDFIEGVEMEHEDGLRADRDPISVKDASGTKRDDGGYRVEFTMVSPAYSKVDKAGKVVHKIDPVSATVVTDTQWADGHWVLKDWILK
ncbi:DUF6318 family protein [Janibacter anophelis]|uniref:DUF6318 family protein n=1 Tax=Janibacter anophelis TaxID=319054 RepID=UPI003F7FE9EA